MITGFPDYPEYPDADKNTIPPPSREGMGGGRLNKKAALLSGFFEVPGGFEPPSPVLQTDP